MDSCQEIQEESVPKKSPGTEYMKTQDEFMPSIQPIINENTKASSPQKLKKSKEMINEREFNVKQLMAAEKQLYTA